MNYAVEEVRDMPRAPRQPHYNWRPFAFDIAMRLERTKPPKALRCRFSSRRHAHLAQLALHSLARDRGARKYFDTTLIDDDDGASLYVMRGSQWFPQIEEGRVLDS